MMKKMLIVSLIAFAICLGLSATNSFASEERVYLQIDKTLQPRTQYSHGPYKKTNVYYQYYFLNMAKTSKNNPCFDCMFDVNLNGPYYENKTMTMNTQQYFLGSLMHEVNADYYLIIQRSEYSALPTTISSYWAINPTYETYWG